MLKKHMTGLGKNTQFVKNQGKGARAQILPSRHALQTLTKGNPMDRTMQDYAKATPMGNPQPTTPDIQGGYGGGGYG